jgi:hypothetical protein
MSKRKKRTSPINPNECIIPPAIPDSALPNLMFKRDVEAERAIREYVERQAKDERVTHAERVTTEYALGRKLEGWDVRNDKTRWWVITSPTNLYSQELFPSLDYTMSFHVGVTARMMAEPDSGVPVVEQLLMSAAWRRWEQAAEALDEAEEIEDFQAVGMRCRECLVSMVKTVGHADMVSEGEVAPKRSDVVAWCELIANRVAHGSSAEHVRKYLKATSKAGWQLVNWLTHAEHVAMADAILAIELTQHILATFGTAVFRHIHGIPDRCPVCGSYKIGLRSYPQKEAEAVPSCQACGWDIGHVKAFKKLIPNPRVGMSDNAGHVAPLE